MSVARSIVRSIVRSVVTGVVATVSGFFALLKNTSLPAGSTMTSGSAWVPTFDGVASPYLLVETATNEAVWPGMRRAAEGDWRNSISDIDPTPLHPEDSKGNLLAYPLWVSGTAVLAGDYVYHLRKYYQATADDAINTTAPASAPNWVEQGNYSPYAGLMVHPSITNKVECDSVPAQAVGTTANAGSPGAINGMTLSGDAAAILSIVDGEDVSNVDWGDGTFRDLSGVNAAGTVYKGTCPGGAASGFATITGDVANTNIQSLAIVARAAVGTLSAGLTGGAQASTTSVTYELLPLLNQTPLAGTDKLVVEIPPNAEVYFFLPQLIESNALPLPIIETFAGSSTTLAATNAQVPTAPYLRDQNCGVSVLVRPAVDDQGGFAMLLASYVDGSNDIRLTFPGTGLIRFEKKIAGSSIGRTVDSAYSAAANVEFQADIYWSESGMGIRIREVGSDWLAWTTNVNTESAPVSSTLALGNRNNANHFDGEILSIETVKSSDPKAALEALA
jgi:hypothetical protein